LDRDGRHRSSVELVDVFALTPLLLVWASAALAATAPVQHRSTVLLERNLNPPVDAKGRPWRVEVLRDGSYEQEEPLASANARRDGTWRHAKVPADRPVRLRVRTEDDDVWWVSPVPFAPGELERTGTIDLGMLPVVGIARIGKQPLPGEVVFTDAAGSLVRFVSNVDGELEGALPRAGFWTSRVRSSAEAFDRSLEVDVIGQEPDEPSFVDVHFPDPALRGEVVDEKGNPVVGFTLAIREARVPTETLEKYEGSTFRYERIAPGEYLVRILAPWRSSPTYRILIPHDDDPDYVKAVVDTRRDFHGRVVSTTGATVPGGIGWLTPDPNGGWSAWQVVPRGPRAAFRGSLPSSAERACLVLHSPGHAMSISAWPATDEQQEIVVSPVGGILDLEVPLVPGLIPVLIRNGCFVHVGLLARAPGSSRDDHGSYLRVLSPLAEPGAYSLCGLTSAEITALPGGVPAFPRCVHGVLAAGARLGLNLGAGTPDVGP
jgi:hypothetical protein